MKKKLRSFFVALFVILHCSSTLVFADDNNLYTDNGFQYYIEENTITIVKYYGNDTVVVVPRFINKHEVKTINSGAFVDSDFQKIRIPDSVTYIESGAINNSTIVEWYEIDGSTTTEQADSSKQETYDKADDKDIEVINPTKKDDDVEPQVIQEDKKSDKEVEDIEKKVKPSDIPTPYVPYTPSKTNTEADKHVFDDSNSKTKKSDTIIIDNSTNNKEYQEAEINIEGDIIEEAKKPSNIVNRVFGTEVDDETNQINEIFKNNFSNQQKRALNPNYVRTNKSSNIIIGVCSMVVFVGLLIYIYVKFVRQ